MKFIPTFFRSGEMLTNRREFFTGLLATIATAAFPFTISTKAWAQASAERRAALLKPGPAGDRVLGRDDAPVAIIEYSSFTCPHCAAFHADILPILKKNYIDTGKVKLIYRDFPLDDLALIVALVAHCVKGDTYFSFLEILYKQQRSWAAAPKVQLTNLAKQVGISEAGFDKCLANQEVLDNIGWVRNRAINEFDVKSTPSIFVNGQKMRAGATIEEFDAAINAGL